MFTGSVARTLADVRSDPSRRTPSSRTPAGKADARSSLPAVPRLRVQSFHVIGDDVHVPGMTFAPSRILRRHIPRLLLKEYLDAIATQYRKSRRIVVTFEPE